MHTRHPDSTTCPACGGAGWFGEFERREIGQKTFGKPLNAKGWIVVHGDMCGVCGGSGQYPSFNQLFNQLMNSNENSKRQACFLYWFTEAISGLRSCFCVR